MNRSEKCFVLIHARFLKFSEAFGHAYVRTEVQLHTEWVASRGKNYVSGLGDTWDMAAYIRTILVRFHFEQCYSSILQNHIQNNQFFRITLRRIIFEETENTKFVWDDFEHIVLWCNNEIVCNVSAMILFCVALPFIFHFECQVQGCTVALNFVEASDKMMFSTHGVA